MNLKHEMFWNTSLVISLPVNARWTLNMKCFEILFNGTVQIDMKEWTLNMKCFEISQDKKTLKKINEWTLNMKCFEILNISHLNSIFI